MTAECGYLTADFDSRKFPDRLTVYSKKYRCVIRPISATWATLKSLCGSRTCQIHAASVLRLIGMADFDH
jgi:hypothetical protein